MDLVERYYEFRRKGYGAKVAWERLREEYSRQYPKGGDSSQAWRSISGKVFENVAIKEFETQLARLKNCRSLRVESWSQIPENLQEPLSEKLWVRGEIKPIVAESNVDIIAYEVDDNQAPSRIIAVYSCKVSLRERFQQDLFWAERLRGRGIRFCLITLDHDQVLIKAAQTGNLSSKQASIAAALYDRVYLFHSAEDIKYYVKIFRSIDFLGQDLTLWQKQD